MIGRSAWARDEARGIEKRDFEQLDEAGDFTASREREALCTRPVGALVNAIQ